MYIYINKDKYIIDNYTADKKINSIKIVDALPDDANEYVYKYVHGEFIRDKRKIIERNFEEIKEDKMKELEEFINNSKENGVKYKDRFFKCDNEASENLMQTTMFIDALLPVTWFTRNGENGYIVIESKEEWEEFMKVLAGKMAEIKNKYYQYKYAIEQAETEEDLNNIIFE